jgi:hypothetical protein
LGTKKAPVYGALKINKINLGHGNTPRIGDHGMGMAVKKIY